MMTDFNAIVLTGYGLNCDVETKHSIEITEKSLGEALQEVKVSADRIHLYDVLNEPEIINPYDLMVFIGGFSWGDDHGAGLIQANRMRRKAMDNLLQFIKDGNLVLGICNGFQTITELGLVPALEGKYGETQAALTYNDCGNFMMGWVNLKVNDKSPCVFTKGINYIPLPIRHGEGKFYAEQYVLDQLKENNQVVLQYADHRDNSLANGRWRQNPNGSLEDIAGICDPTGRVFGLMPHPEAFNDPTNHPNYQRLYRKSRGTDNFILTGIKMFENAVKYKAEMIKLVEK